MIGSTIRRSTLLRWRRKATRAAVAAVLVLCTAAAAQAPTDRLPPGVTPRTKEAIDRGLAYLARTQNRQGYWVNSGVYGGYPVAMTGLAGLAMLMDGNTTTQGRYAQNVDRAARFLTSCGTTSGLIAQPEQEGRPMYGHGFAMLFLGQVVGMTESAQRAEEIQTLLGRAVQLTARAQSWAGGWMYTPDSGGDEGSVTITQVQALRSCRNAGVAVPKEVIDQAMAYLIKSQNSDGGIRYRAGQPGESRPPITAAAVCCWYNAGEYGNVNARRAMDFAKRMLLRDVSPTGHDMYAQFYLAQALWAGKDPAWTEYYERQRDRLLASQRPDGSWVGDGVGDIYGTAIALVILQLPYNTVPIMQQ